jgi:hypothetical protein
MAAARTEDEAITVHEAVGPPLSLNQASAAMAMGMVSLLMMGVLPVLLGGLVDLHRLSASGIGVAATLEGLMMGVSTGLAGPVLPPRGLRLWGFVSAIVLVGLDLATARASGGAVIGLRAVAGVPEGILLWITVGMIARSETPERLAGILLAGSTAAQFVLALGFTVFVLPRFGSDGGFVALAAVTALAVPAAWFLPQRFAPLVKPVNEGTAPPLRGWAALAASAVFIAAYGAVAVYLQPLAHEAGLDANVARIALTVSLLLQVAGGACAALIAGRVHYMVVFSVGTLGYLASWLVMGSQVPAWAFIAANGLNGFAYLIMVPFFVPMLIEADPSRRAAVMGGGAQVLGGALGPFLASRVVSDADVHGALWLGGALLVTGLVMMAGMHAVERRERVRRQLAVVE